MFTVKHISIDGSENLIEAKEVKFSPAIDTGLTGRPASLDLDGVPYGGGTFFVMNANGKTVARYDLGASPVPHVGTHEEPKYWRGDLPWPPTTGVNPTAGQPVTIGDPHVSTCRA